MWRPHTLSDDPGPPSKPPSQVDGHRCSDRELLRLVRRRHTFPLQLNLRPCHENLGTNFKCNPCKFFTKPLCIKFNSFDCAPSVSPELDTLRNWIRKGMARHLHQVLKILAGVFDKNWHGQAQGALRCLFCLCFLQGKRSARISQKLQISPYCSSFEAKE